MLLKDLRVFNTPDAAVDSAAPVTVPPSVIDSSPEPTAAPSPEPVVAPPAPASDLPPDVNPNAPKWALRRISDEAEGRRKAIERAEAAERERTEALALVESLRRQQPDTPASRFAPAPAAAPMPTAEIERMAARMKLHEDSTEVLNRGMTTFGPAFQGSLAVLNAANVVNNDEFVADLIAVDRANAHVLLDRLAKEPERAATLAAMSSRQRIAELTRMSLQPAKDAKPVSPGVSKAPAPAPHVAPSSSNVRDWRTDDTSDSDFDSGFREMMKKRSRRR